MIEPFLLRALLGGTAVALVAAPLGCFVVWGRMAYFGDALAHGALLGVALGAAFHLDLNLGTLLVFTAFITLLAMLRESRWWSTDTLLGLLSHSALSIGLVVLALLPGTRSQLLGFLIGDILSITWTDIWWITGLGALILGLLLRFWSLLLLVTVNEEMAQAEGIPVARLRLLIMVLVALVILIAMKIIGVLLISALLIIPAASARPHAQSPEAMAALAALAGVIAVWGGLWGSLWWDTPAGPTVVSMAAALLFAAWLAARLRAVRA